jgi:hypothetical protein
MMLILIYYFTLVALCHFAALHKLRRAAFRLTLTITRNPDHDTHTAIFLLNLCEAID